MSSDHPCRRELADDGVGRHLRGIRHGRGVLWCRLSPGYQQCAVCGRFLRGLFDHLRGSLDSSQDDDTSETGQNRPRCWWSDDALAGSGHGRDHLPPAGEHFCCPGSSTDSSRCRLLEPEHGITSGLPESACAGKSQRDADHHGGRWSR